MEKILLTGGAGFIGSHLTDSLIGKGYECSILDNLSVHDGKIPEYFNKEAEFIKGDVRDYNLLKKIVPRFDVIFHKAASVGIAQSNYEIIDFVDNNERGTASLLQAIIDTKHHKKLKKLILASSNTTYGEGLYFCEQHKVFHPSIRSIQDVQKYGLEIICKECEEPAKPIPTPESTSQPCNSIYSLTKRNQEDMCITIGKLYDFPMTVLRYFNVYGPRQSLSNPYTGVSAIFASKIKNNSSPTIYEDGLQTRDFVSVHDVVQANILVMINSSTDNKIFNVGTGQPQTIKNVAYTIAKIHNKKIDPEIINEFRKGDIRHCIADYSKFNKATGWVPKVSFEEGIKELIKWSENQDSQDKTAKADKELRDKGLL